MLRPIATYRSPSPLGTQYGFSNRTNSTRQPAVSSQKIIQSRRADSVIRGRVVSTAVVAGGALGDGAFTAVVRFVRPGWMLVDIGACSECRPSRRTHGRNARSWCERYES